MTISNHERLAFAAKIARYGDNVSALHGIHAGLMTAVDFSDDPSSLIDLAKMVDARMEEIYAESRKKRRENAAEWLAQYETLEEKAACLRRLAFTIEEAFDAGLIEDPAPFHAAA